MGMEGVISKNFPPERIRQKSSFHLVKPHIKFYVDIEFMIIITKPTTIVNMAIRNLNLNIP